jgi:hypothetical protein
MDATPSLWNKKIHDSTYEESVTYGTVADRWRPVNLCAHLPESGTRSVPTGTRFEVLAPGTVTAGR